MRALLRRGARPLQLQQRQTLAIGDLLLDLTNRRAFRGDEELSLSQKEFDLLACLMQNQGVTLSRDVLLEQVWGEEFKHDARTVDVHIRWLRAKIEQDPAHPIYIGLAQLSKCSLTKAQFLPAAAWCLPIFCVQFSARSAENCTHLKSKVPLCRRLNTPTA